MKKDLFTGIIVSSFLFCQCTTDNLWPEMPGGGMGPNEMGGSASGLIDLGELSNFKVEFDYSPLQESEVIPTGSDDPYYNEYIENNFSAQNTTSILFDNNNVVVENKVKGDTIIVEGCDVVVKAHSKGLVLKVSGKTDNGSLRIYSEKKFELLLSDVTLTNSNGAAINIQNGNCFVQLEGANKLSDNSDASYTSHTEEDEKAVFFSEDDLRFAGSGSLSVYANNKVGKSGIASDDALFFRPGIAVSVNASSSAGHGIKANDAVVVKGGVFNVQTEAAGKKAFTTDGIGSFAGGRITAITKGGVDASVTTDPTGAACIKSDSTLTVTGGELRLMSSGQGGKGISCDENIYIEGGSLYILTSGNMYGSSSNNRPGGGWGNNNTSSSDNTVSPKGIKGDKDVVITGGDIFVRTSGTNAEGIESKATLRIAGGNVAVSAYDDGLNASKAINVSGGRVFSLSSGEGDGIDSNGSISVTGGVVIGIASTMGSEEGIDLENSTFTISDATVISIGGRMGMGMGARYEGHYVSATISGDADQYVSLGEENKPMVVFKLPRTYKNASLLFSTPDMKGNNSYTLTYGSTPVGGELWINLLEGATSVSGGSSVSVTAK